MHHLLAQHLSIAPGHAGGLLLTALCALAVGIAAALLARRLLGLPTLSTALAALLTAAAATAGLVALQPSTAHLVALALLSAAILAVACHTYRCCEALKPFQRLLLPSLRAGAMLLTLALLAGLQLPIPTEPIDLRETLILLQDASKSMSLPDQPAEPAADAPTRYTASLDAWANASPQLAELARRFRIVRYSLGPSPRPLGAGWEADTPANFPPLPDLPRTAVYASLLELLQQPAHRAGPLGPTIILLSDGADNASTPRARDELLSRLPASAARIFAACVGQPDAPAAPRIALETLQHPDTLSPAERLVVSAELRVDLPDPQTQVIATLLDQAGQPLASAPATSTSRPGILQVRLDHTPTGSGLRIYALQLDIRPAPPTSAPASPPQPLPLPAEGRLRVPVVVNIQTERFRALLIEARPRREFGAVSTALARGQTIDLDRRLVLDRAPAALAKAGLPTTTEQWARYSVVILGDVRADLFDRAQLDALASAVDQGTGLVLLGGLENYASFQATPLAPLLPFENPGQTTQSAQPALIQPVPGSELDQFLALRDQQGRSVGLAELGPQPGAAEWPPIKPAARVWATLQPLPSAPPVQGAQAPAPPARPAIAVQRYGRGRCIALAFDHTWTWQLTRDDGPLLLAQFWQQIIYAANPLFAELQLELSDSVVDLARTDRPPLRALARITDRQRAPANGPNVRLERIGPIEPGAAPPALRLPIDRAGAGWAADIPVEEPGFYILLATTTGPAGNQLRAARRFRAHRDQPELDHAQPDPAALRQLADATAAQGGRSFAPSELADLLSSLAPRTPAPAQTAVRYAHAVDLHPWPIFLLLTTLLTAEWLIRKRLGLL